MLSIWRCHRRWALGERFLVDLYLQPVFQYWILQVEHIRMRYCKWYVDSSFPFVGKPTKYINSCNAPPTPNEEECIRPEATPIQASDTTSRLLCYDKFGLHASVSWTNLEETAEITPELRCRRGMKCIETRQLHSLSANGTNRSEMTTRVAWRGKGLAPPCWAMT